MFQEGLDGYAGNKSASVFSNAPDTNFGTSNVLTLTYSSLAIRASLIQFNLSAIPQNATIDNATLELTTFSNGIGVSSVNVAVHRVTAPWDEATLTWNNSVSAAVYDPTPVTVQSINGQADSSISSLDLTTLVQQWVDGTAENYGFMLEVPELPSGVVIWSRNFHSDDSTTQTSRPKLTVSYTIHASSVVVTPATLPLVLGGSTGQLSANVQPDDAFNKNVQWASSDTAIATVDASGRVTPVALGTAIITATTEDGNFTDSSTVTVTSANLSDLVLSEGELTPTFNGGTTSYSAVVANSVYSLTATPTTADTNATVTVNGAPVASGMPSQAVPLNVGNNEVNVTVTAQDNVTKKTYTIMITRRATAPPPTDNGGSDSGDGGGTGGGGSTPTTPANPTSPPVGSGGAACPKLTWTDIQNHWAKSDIELASQLCLVQGSSSDKFLPDDGVTRLQFALMVARAMKLQDSGNTAVLDTFADRADIPAWATAELSAAVRAGIIEGYENETLRPNEMIIRAEMVTMLIRGWNMSASNGTTSFMDNADIPGWAKGYVVKAEREGIIKGRSNNRLEPFSTATRAEAVVVLVRMLQDKS
ncbi:DNRLRE domain-containing protein [Paenibacillus algorifonticola]|uniref:DNRLRE domain-containing protein n=1 Tax=Paenibacillus algorifonticola TaxID=684063 RepID=UPI003D2923F0